MGHIKHNHGGSTVANGSTQKAQEAEVINFVYKLSQAVKRLEDGAKSPVNDFDSLLSGLDRMEAVAGQMADKYPDLPATLDRMRLRLFVLISKQQRSEAGSA